MSYITAIGTANPSHRFEQSTIADFMMNTMKVSHDQGRKLKAIFKASGIDYRYSVLEDYGKTGSFKFFSKIADADIFPSTADRLKIFKNEAVPLSIASVKNMLNHYPSFQLESVTHVVVVSCTGMYAPGLDIDLVKELNLPSTVQRTAINFMGCYAAFNALKVADAFCTANENAKVLIVCTELCSLHFQALPTDDNLLANALFADGSAAVLVEGKSESPVQLSLENFHSDLAYDGAQDMAWHVGDLGFEMKLSAYIPEIIRKGIASLTTTLLDKLSKKIGEIKHFAIHPGGKKILEAIEKELGMTPDDNRSAYEVLRLYGNMSSPTVLFVLKEVVSHLTVADKDSDILSFAFGPGLTLESMVLRVAKV